MNCKATGEVKGSVLNQFSMDENDGYFRIATTVGEVTGIGENVTHTPVSLTYGTKIVVAGGPKIWLKYYGILANLL